MQSKLSVVSITIKLPSAAGIATGVNNQRAHISSKQYLYLTYLCYASETTEVMILYTGLFLFIKLN